MKLLQISSLAALIALSGVSASHGTTIVDETFSDGNRTGQTPPDSLLWYSAKTASTLTAATGSLTMTTDDNFVLGYVTDANSPVTLNVGDKLTLTVVFSGELTGTASPTGLRFGLLNSQQSRISSTGLGPSNAAYLNYLGYAVAFGNDSSNTKISSSVWERNPGSANTLIDSSSSYTTGSTSSSSGSLASNTPYTLTLTLDYQSATQMVVTSSLTGEGLSGVTSTSVDTTPITSFDTIVLHGGANPFSNMTFSSVNLAVVPEPSAASLLGSAGLVILGGGLLKIRKSGR